MFTRELTFDPIKGLADDAAIPATIASETPYDRGDYIEVLRCDKNGVDLVRAPLPVCVQHDSNRLAVGVAENVRARGSRVTADIRFGTSPEARQIRADVVAGIHRSLSVGYELLGAGEPIADATFKFSWRPHEVSIVSVPADPTAGFFRSKEITMSQIETEAQPHLSRSQRIAMSDNGHEAEAQRTREIAALGQQFKEFGAEPMALDALSRGESTAAFTKRLMEHVSSDTPKIPALGTSSFMSQNERKGYSLLRAVEAHITGDYRKAGFEREVHDHLAAGVNHRSVSGLLIPAGDLAKKLADERRYQKRDMTVATAANGGYLVGTDHRPDAFIDLLREASVVLSMGATRLSDLVGNADIPATRSDPTPFWQATEATAIPESWPTIGQVLLSPKTIGAYTEVSRRLLKQATPQAEAIIINSMIATLGRGIDLAALNGSGINGEPKGLLQQTGLSAFTGTSIDWPAILDAESDVAEAELDLTGSNVGWVTTPAIRKLLKSRVKVAGYPEYLWQSPDNTMNGYKALATKVCPAGTLIFGDWSEIIVAEWGVIEIDTAPSNFAAGIVGIRAMADVDLNIKHAGAFSVATSVT